MKKLLLIFVIIISFNAESQTTYFPPVTGTQWDTISPQTLGWCMDKVDTLINYVGKTNAKAFIILKNGKIVIEKYYGTFTQDSSWYWASAGKSLTAFLIGLAQEQGYLNIHDSLPKYLGHGFSSCDKSAEDSIRIIHQLSMTTGFNDDYAGVPDNYCTDPSCLVCIAPPGTRWAYHTAPYTMLDWVIDSATGKTVNAFKASNLNSQTGITGQFYPSGYLNVYYSTARSFARFGLLISNHGIWNTDTIMHDTSYFRQMINTSQNINLSYGYLWWLNGKTSYHIPQTQLQFPGPLVPDAPADMFAALGKNNQILNIVPSLGLVMIRMGNTMDSTSLEVSNSAADSIWVRLKAAMCSVLNIKLLTLNGITENDKTFLTWSMATETVNDYFLVQRSGDKINFATIGTVKSANYGSGILNYSFADIHPLSGINYYRIVQTNANGESNFSQLIAVKYSADKTNTVTVYPDPANSFIQLSFTQTQNNFGVEIINTLGEIVLKTQEQYKLDISQLQKGIYFLKINSGNDLFVKKFEKL
jgi:CubicO group peptidase (beta-lactamase class C family)